MCCSCKEIRLFSALHLTFFLFQVCAFNSLVEDYKLPIKTEFSRHFYEVLKPNIKYLNECRPKSVSMANLIRGFKNKITECHGKNEEDAKSLLTNYLDEFLDERLLTAGQLICDFGVRKIESGDVILTYACSFVVFKLLEAAHNEGKDFSVIVVDSNPLKEGKEFLRRISSLGVECTYVFLNAASCVMKRATKVIVGAYAMLSNGNLVSRVGTAMVALSAHSYGVPLIVCCESIKFSEKIMLDSITWNELGDVNQLAKGALSDWKDVKTLSLLSILYDITPIEYITMVITEFGMIPPTSVPVILRECGAVKKEEE